MPQSYFANIPPIHFEGLQSENPLGYRYYDKDRVVLGKRMEDHLRMAVCYWHTFCSEGADMFGPGTFGRPWHAGPMDQAHAEHKLNEAFEFFTRLGLPYFCFHDTDVMATANTIREHVDKLARIGECIQEKMTATRVKLLWGTANLFSHPRYMAGAASNPDPDVFRFAATQVRHCIELTKRLGGQNYVLWGGREGYDMLLNTDLKQEKAQLGRFLKMVVEHKHKIGFTGTILIEPKPHEPTKHQYDFDVETVYAFLLSNGLEKEVRLCRMAGRAGARHTRWGNDAGAISDAAVADGIDPKPIRQAGVHREYGFTLPVTAGALQLRHRHRPVRLQHRRTRIQTDRGEIKMAFQLRTFQGVRYALFHYNTGASSGGHADFDDFVVAEPRPRGLTKPSPYGQRVAFSNLGNGGVLAVSQATASVSWISCTEFVQNRLDPQV